MRKYFIKPASTIPFTKIGYQKVLEEKAKLLAQRPEAVDHLKKSREMGDLSENGYYKASRAKLSSIDARLRRVERLVRLGRVVETMGTDVVGIGNLVTITDGTNQFAYTLVGGYESDPAQKTISHISPLGRAIVGRKKNDEVDVFAPSGKKTYTIVDIS